MTPSPAGPSWPEPCCPPRPTAARPENPPGRPAIRFRLGTFSTFRRAMLEQLKETAKSGPLVGWREGTPGDYQTTFVELWAYLADVLTFYQERVANEAYLETATQPESLDRICRLIGYRPAPGSGAGVLLAFTVEKGKEAVVPAGFRVGKKPTPGEEPVVYETAAPLAARGDHNAVPVAATARTNPFAPLADYARPVGGVYPGMPDALRDSLVAATPPDGTAPGAWYESRFELARKNVRPVVLKGTSAKLVPGDHVLIVEFEGDVGRENATLRQLDAVVTDKATNTTTVLWTEQTAADAFDSGAALYALRVTAGVFGNRAPDWNSLPATLTNRDKKTPGARWEGYWDKPKPDLPQGHTLPSRVMIDTGSDLFLDAQYPLAAATAQHPGWVVFLNAEAKTVTRVPLAGTNPAVPPDPKPSIFHVTGTAPASHTDFALSEKVTQLTLNRAIPNDKFPLRTTVVLTGAERLTVQDELPLPAAVTGRTLTLAGRYEHLAAGQPVVVAGPRTDGTREAEGAALAVTPEYHAGPDLTVVRLTADLTGTYLRPGTVVHANVVAATHGETVRDEVLGSGDGSAFQAFALRKGPLTYLPATGPEGLSAVRDTLRVTVNGVRWVEVPVLFGQPPDAPAYTALTDATGATTVAFGDGRSGAAPPAGRDNIRARYRRGLGRSGNAPAAAVGQLLDSVPGVQKVTNPLPARGGTDPERPDRVRRAAPADVRPFGRAVSAQDYADLALGFPGVGQARAAWVAAPPHVRLVVALADGSPLAAERGFADALRAYLDRRRDPNVPLRIVAAREVFVTLTVRVDVADRHPRRATVEAVRAALAPGTGGFFAPDRRPLGAGVTLADVYRTVQAVPGIAGAVVTTLGRVGDPDAPPADVGVGPDEVVVLRDDPALPGEGVLTVERGDGGYADT